MYYDEVKFRKNVYLKNITWMKVGGPAEIFFRPQNLVELVQFIKNNDSVTTTIGLGSNIIVRDSGIKGTVIRLGRGFNYLSCEGATVTAGASVLDYNLANFAMENNISGLEFMCGIPGTVGGALAMNAGCYGGEIASVLRSAKVVDENGEVLTLSNDEIGFFYRGNSLPKNWIFIEAKFVGKKGDSKQIQKRMVTISNNRNSTQPIRSKTCGSIFKNPPGYKAWELIDKVNGRGLAVGDAQISKLHCNFVINNGNATARDVEDLCEIIRKKVQDVFGVNLEWELIRLGN